MEEDTLPKFNIDEIYAVRKLQIGDDYTNYTRWEDEITIAMLLNKREQFLEEHTCPSTMSPEVWQSHVNQCSKCVTMTLDISLLEHLALGFQIKGGRPPPWEVLKRLRERFEPRAEDLIREFHQISLDNFENVSSYSEHFSEIKWTLDRIYPDLKIPEAVMVSKFLLGLGPEYMDFRLVLARQEDLLKVTLLEVTLRARTYENINIRKEAELRRARQGDRKPVSGYGSAGSRRHSRKRGNRR